MGIFDSLFGKKKDAPPPARGQAQAAPPQQAAPPSWRSRTAHIDWDWDNPQARQITHEILNAAAPRFGNAKVKEVPDDEHIDLRGTYDDAPVRFAIWMSFGSFWSIEMRCPNRHGEIDIERDHEKIPKHGDSDDPWDEDEDRRIFLAKGIFVEGDDEEVAQKINNFSSLPDDVQARILTDMERLDINAVRSYSDSVSLNQNPGLGDLDDPIGYLEACAQLMATIKNAIAEGDAEVGERAAVQIRGPVMINGVMIEPDKIQGAASVGSQTQISCKFCSSLWLLTATQSNCPNCGAPASQ